jgi:hypothetical protein
MALAISLTPNVPTFIQGDAPISVSMGAGGTNNSYPLWESNSGTFDDKYAATTNFTPHNATKTVSIIGRRVNRIAASNSANIWSNGGGVEWGKGLSGTNHTWDTFVTLADYLNVPIGHTGFFQAQTLDITEKSIAFSNSGELNPEIVGNSSNSVAYAWHLQANGLATPRTFGNMITEPVPYKIGTIFKVEITLSVVNYYVDGVWICSAPLVASNGYWAILSFKTTWSWWANASYMNYTVYADAEGIATLNSTGLFPVQPNYPYNISLDVGILASPAIDGSEIRRKKSKERRIFNLQFNERPYFEYQLIADFWKFHEKHERFVFQDLILNESYVVRFDAPLSTNMRGADTVDIQATLKEV